MEVSAEISYYPLQGDYNTPVSEFIDKISKKRGIIVETGLMSTLVTGTYEDVMLLLSQTIKPFMVSYPSVFSIKIANACKACQNGNT